MFYGAVVWDPCPIVARIGCIQCIYYLTLGIFFEIFVGTRVSRMNLVYFFDYATVTASTVTGWCVIASFLLSSLAGCLTICSAENNIFPSVMQLVASLTHILFEKI